MLICGRSASPQTSGCLFSCPKSGPAAQAHHRRFPPTLGLGGVRDPPHLVRLLSACLASPGCCCCLPAACLLLLACLAPHSQSKGSLALPASKIHPSIHQSSKSSGAASSVRNRRADSGQVPHLGRGPNECRTCEQTAPTIRRPPSPRGLCHKGHQVMTDCRAQGRGLQKPSSRMEAGRWVFPTGVRSQRCIRWSRAPCNGAAVLPTLIMASHSTDRLGEHKHQRAGCVSPA